jgi:nucleotide-binding universal stress UspA family protein
MTALRKNCAHFPFWAANTNRKSGMLRATSGGRRYAGDGGQIMESKKQPYIIVVGIDYSESSAGVLAEAFDLSARKTPAGEPHVVHVAPPYGTGDGTAAAKLEQAANQLETYVQAQIKKYTAGYPNNGEFERVCVHQCSGEAAEQIVQLAVDLEADLVMVGTHSRRGVERLLLGSVAERVVRTAPQIEPACSQCIATRKSTAGKELWCAQHSERHGSRHTYHYLHRNMAESNLPLIGSQRRG